MGRPRKPPDDVDLDPERCPRSAAIAPGRIWLEDGLLQTLLHPDLTERWLQQIVAARVGLNDSVWPVPVPGPTIAWPKLKITYGRSRSARPPREPGDESEIEEERV